MRLRVGLALAAFVASATLGVAAAEDAPDAFAKEVEKALDRYQDGGFAKAVELCEARVKARPSDYAALLELARLDAAREDFEGAVKHAEQAKAAADKDATRLRDARVLHLLVADGAANAEMLATPEAEREKAFERLQARIEALEKEVVDSVGADETPKLLQAENERISSRRGFLAIGKPLDKAIETKDTDGKEIQLAEYRGKVLLVDFWATWCSPCLEELPNVQKTYESLHAKGFEVIGISLDNDRAKLDEFLKEKKLPWRQVFDGKGWENAVAVAFKVHEIPKTYLVDHEGKVRFVDVRGAELEKAVNELLARAKGEKPAEKSPEKK